ncbi:dipeptidase [Sphingomonas sp. ERG5]|uniref:dipeptidase n=1 Tax=Sphingomonas sp. ERG5 TaxID=1381597 RepID=UPI00054C321A|nr:membrane dipeptidase [Sphingomonas sp. ERG5]
MTNDALIDRRHFSLGAAALAASVFAPAARAESWAVPSTAPIQPRIRALYDRSIVIDALASPSTWNVFYPAPGPLTAEQLDNIRKSGLTAINLTVGKPGTLIETVREIGLWLRQIELHPDRLLLVRRHADIAAAKAQKKLAVIFGFQGMGMIGEDLTLIDTFADYSVKIMQLTYNDKNALGAGSSMPEKEGLSALGREAVARMNARNILVDLGHANPTTALDATGASSGPVTISHTGCRAVFDSQRNLPDPVLRAVAEKGGVVGIYLMPFLGNDPIAPSKALFMRHLRHAIDICGEDHVGIGTDQSITPIDISPTYMAMVRKTAAARKAAGIGAPGEADGPITVPELNSARRIELIAAELDKAKYPISTIEKVIGGNFDRLFRTVWHV